MKFSVLIVEDDPKIAEIHQHFTEKVEGFEVVGIAVSIADAEKMSQLLMPDLVLLDYYFPDGQGTDILWRILRQPERPLVDQIARLDQALGLRPNRQRRACH